MHVCSNSNTKLKNNKLFQMLMGEMMLIPFFGNYPIFCYFLLLIYIKFFQHIDYLTFLLNYIGIVLFLLICH